MSENVVQNAPETATPVEPKKLTKLQIKKLQQHQERRQRLINKGVPEEQVEAVIAREDYEKLPVAEKLKRLEGFVAGALNHLAGEMNNLRHNDGVLADAMDINFKAIAKALVKAGVSLEDQKAIVLDIQKEIEEEQKARAAAAEKAQQEAIEKAKVADQKSVDAPGEAPPAPAEATTFGG